MPIATADPTGNGIRRTDVIEAALLLDRPTWIRFLNRRATWSILAQATSPTFPTTSGYGSARTANRSTATSAP
ncbi:MAG: hypothetical protein ACREQ9_10940 [Candidatus Binatia bacterium]